MKTYATPVKALVALLLGAWTLQAHAGFFEDDEARKAILDLRQKVEQIQQATVEDSKKITEENAQLRRSLLELSNQLEAMRQETAKIRGEQEQITRNLGQFQKSQKDLAQGLNERLKKVEPEKVTIDNQQFLADAAEIRAFEDALEAFRAGDFSKAQNALGEFNKRYPESGYKPSALFWQGNAQYALRNYRPALVSFKILVAQTPEHARASEAMLSIANCEIELKDIKAARKTLTTLIKLYPRSEAASVAKERLSNLR